MSALGNLLWIVLGGGIVIFAEYLILAILLGVTVIGLPAARQCWKLAVLGLLPFGRRVSPGGGAGSALLNVLWLLPAGLLLALTHLLFALICGVTIIGIPFARQHLKLAHLALGPFGAEIK